MENIDGIPRRTNKENDIIEPDVLENVVVERGKVVRFDELPPKSIALDGYTQGPNIDLKEGRFSFDHHGECIRLVTQATCQQVLHALLLGLNPKKHTIYVNDVDGDTALSVWLLKNPSRASDEKVRRAVESIGGRDAHGPAFPALDEDLVNAFYKGALGFLSDMQRNEEYAKADLREVLKSCLENIDRLFDGTLEWSPQSEKDRHFEVTHVGDGWAMVESSDSVFDILYTEGHTRAVLYTKLEDGSFRYTVGKKSDLVQDFPVGPQTQRGTILHALNEREAGWGGGSAIGGSPRNEDGSASRLMPDEVFSIIESVITEK